MFKSAIIIANKRDIVGADKSSGILLEKYSNIYRYIAVSALKKENLEELKRMIFEVSGRIRVYSKASGKEPDMAKPFTIPCGSTILDLARLIHKEFIFTLRFARIWGLCKIRRSEGAEGLYPAGQGYCRTECLKVFVFLAFL